MAAAVTDVVVIGAGLSGLYAARLLNQRAFRVTVVEAANYVGGRVVSTAPGSFAPWPVALGAEFIHGRNVITQLAGENGWPMQTCKWPDRYFLDGRLLLAADAVATSPHDFEKMDEYMDDLDELDSNDPEGTVEDYLVSRGLPQAMLPLADVIYAHDMAASLKLLGMRESIAEARAWTYGIDEYFLLHRGFGQLVDWLRNGLDVRTNWQVKRVDHRAPAVSVTSVTGETLSCRHVMVTVPLPVIRDGDIEFDPPLGTDKVEAAKTISFGNVIKIIVRFHERLWPEGTFDVVCPNCPVPEVWMTTYPDATGDGAGVAECYVVTGYAAGPAADAMSLLENDDARLECFLDQLTAMFGRDARQLLADHIVHDWSREPFVRGAFTFPSIGARSGSVAREVLSAPVGDRIFFCGEATHTGCNNCTHGAMETAVRAVNELLVAVGRGTEAFAIPVDQQSTNA